MLKEKITKRENMLFFGAEKGLVVNSKKTHKIVARFNENGSFETEDPILIEKLKPYFKHKLKTKNKRRGKTFEEMYGKKKAKNMKRKISKTLRDKEVMS